MALASLPEAAAPSHGFTSHSPGASSNGLNMIPRTGALPYTDLQSASWRKSVAITRLAINNVVASLSSDVLWYHADYVAPSWGRRLSKVSKIGTHIFYRS